jgi:two-component system, NarL family, nitrate/nitrite response regulator NarL
MEQGPPGRLRVALQAPTSERRDALGRLLREAGHSVAEREADVDAVLIELAPTSRVPHTTHPLLILSDSPVLTRDPELEAVLPRSATPAQIEAGLRAAASGLLVRVRERLPGLGFAPATDEVTPLLTAREIEILAAIGEGLSNKEVARRLGISTHTVKFHLESIFDKLEAGTRAEAVAKGLRRGLIEV